MFRTVGRRRKETLIAVLMLPQYLKFDYRVMAITKIRCFLSITFLLAALCLQAQQPSADTTQGKKRIYIINSQRLNYEKKDSAEYQSAVGNVIIRQDSTLFYCDSVVLNKSKNMLEAFGHVHINDADSVHTYADYLRYVGNERKAYLKKNVRLTDGKGTLTTPELEYDINTKIGTYLKGGKVVNDKTVLNSDEGFYYGETRDVYFKKGVVLVSPDYNVKTDTLLYNTYTDVATFIVPTEITSGKNRKVLTSDGYYDLRNKKAYFGKRPQIQDSATFLVADEVAMDDSSGFGEARGNFIYRDTAQGLTIIGNNLKNNRKSESFLATQKPVMILKQDKDSIFIAADTFYSAKLTELLKTRFVPVITDSLPLQQVQTANNKLLALNKGTDFAKNTLIEQKFDTSISSFPELKDTVNATNSLINLPDASASVSSQLDNAATITDSNIKSNDTGSSFSSQPNYVAGITDSAFKNPDTLIQSDSVQTFTFTENSSALLPAPRNVDSSHDRFIEAYYHVKIFSDSLQAVGDSLFYSAEDSAFRLFKNPVVWAQQSQVTGDTIYLFTADKKPKRIYVFENALSIEKVGDDFYNQVKGRTINGWFVNGNLDHLRTKGNAESVYYGKDENNKFLGVNKNTCDIIDVYFTNKEAQRVIWRSNLQGTAYPMRQVNHEEMRLRGFQWEDSLRPKTKYDLFGN